MLLTATSVLALHGGYRNTESKQLHGVYSTSFHFYRFRRAGRRKTIEIFEVCPGANPCESWQLHRE